MAVDTVSFWLKPAGFFDRNPALDVPPPAAHCHHRGEADDRSSSRNFIHGERVAAADGRTTRLVDPSTGEVYATAPLSSDADVDAAFQDARARLREWRDTTPSERQLALLRIADAIEAARRRARRHRVPRTPASRASSPLDEEIPPMCDQIRFFAGAARVLEGKLGGRVHARAHVVDPPRAGRRVRGGDAVELPDDDGRVEVGARARGRQHASSSSRRTPRRPARYGWPRWSPSSCRPACSTSSAATATRAPRSSPPDAARWSRSPAASRAGMAVAKTAADDLKRVHLELGGKAPVIVFDDADLELAAEGIAIARLLQRRPGLHGRHARARRRRASTTTSWPRWPSRRRTRAPGRPSDEDVLYGPLNNANQLAHVSGLVERAPDHATVVTGGQRQGDAATSSSPRSSTACARTTR